MKVKCVGNFMAPPILVLPFCPDIDNASRKFSNHPSGGVEFTPTSFPSVPICTTIAQRCLVVRFPLMWATNVVSALQTTAQNPSADNHNQAAYVCLHAFSFNNYDSVMPFQIIVFCLS